MDSKGEGDLRLGEIGEFGLIAAIKGNCHFSSNRLIQGIGDDCAVIGPYEGKAFLVTTDLLVEDIHFILGKTDSEHLGRKAMAVNLSDIAAMGGTPLHGFISVAIPKSLHVATVRSIYSGMKEMCRRYRFNILGGDMSASPDRLVINVALMGEIPEGEVLYRRGARKGDGIYVTGTLGDSAGGLKLITEDLSAPEEIAAHLKEAHNLPVPMLEMGRTIAASRLAGAMMDISDGLVSDLRHICEASDAGAVLFRSSLPLSEEVRSFSRMNDLDPYDLALYGGEDYRLLVTVPSENREAFEALFRNERPCPVFLIGEITDEKGIRVSGEDGLEKALKIKGYDHFY